MFHKVLAVFSLYVVEHPGVVLFQSYFYNVLRFNIFQSYQTINGWLQLTFVDSWLSLSRTRW
jgi:hypothetical protein